LFSRHGPGYIKESPLAAAHAAPGRRAAERVITSRELLAGAHRIWIEHATERYLLQVTRSGKLIHTK
jgi:hemin uptake protein HemP